MFISDLNLHTVNSNVIDIIEDTKFAILTVQDDLQELATKKIADVSGNCVTFLAGMRIEKQVTSIQLLSGAVLTY